jgi:glyoxylase-like metal-dependent hydrolase (beta-lactamase superfamily II)
MQDLVFAELNEGCDCRSYLVGSRSAGEAAIVDPLLERVDPYLKVLRALALRLALAIDTHTHADHLSGVRELSLRTGAKSAGAPAGSVALPLYGGERLTLGAVALAIIATPGHTADSISIRLEDRVLSADTLLIGATGRTDLPTGDCEQEWRSVLKLLELPDELLLFPGHDYAGQERSTIGEERRTNPRIVLGREKFLEAMREPRSSKPVLMEQALAYNKRPF